MILRKLTKRGFSALELLLALAIFAIISVPIYGVFSSGMRLNRYSARDNQVFREARMALDLMSKEIENMVFYDFANSYADRDVFSPLEDKITLILPGEGELNVVRYELVSDEIGSIHKVVVGKTYKRNVSVINSESRRLQKFSLVRKVIALSEYLENESFESVEAEIIATNILSNGLSFDYEYPKEEVSSIDDKQRIPASVHLEIVFVVGDNDDEKLQLSKDVLFPQSFKMLEELES